MLPAKIGGMGIEMTNVLLRKRQTNEPDTDTPHIPPMAALVFLITVSIGVLLLAAISYTYGHVITTLCMIESSSSNAYVPIESVEPAEEEPPAYTEDGVPKPTDPELNIIRTRPITTSLRATVEHLKARGGFWSRFRGFAVYFVWNFARSFIIGIMSAASSNPLVTIVAAIIAEVALVRLLILIDKTRANYGDRPTST